MKIFGIQPNLRLKNNEFGDPKDRGEELIRIGRLSELGPLRDIYFDISGERVVGIFGKRGSGKSYTLGSFIEGFFTKEKKTDINTISHKRAGILFDTLNIFWSLKNKIDLEDSNPYIEDQIKSLKKWKITPGEINATIFVPKGTRMNTTPKDYKDFSIDVCSLEPEDWGSLFDFDLYLDRMGQLLNDVWVKVVIDGWTDNQNEISPNAIYNIEDVLQCLKNDDEIQEYYNKETIRGLYQRFNSLKNVKIFSGKGIELNDLLKKGNLSVLELNQLDDNLRTVVTSVIIRKILRERSKASELEKQLKLNTKLDKESIKKIEEYLEKSIPHTWVFIDEAQLLLPSEKKTKASEVIVKFVKEGRNHGLSLAFTTQQPSAIDSRVMSQLDTLIVHKLTVRGDIDIINKHLKTSNPQSIKYANRQLDFEDLVRMQDCGQAIVTNTETDRNFVIEIRPRITAHGGIEG